LRLCYIENSKYGGVEIGNFDGPLGRHDGPKLLAYAAVLGEKSFKDHISQLLKKSLRDHEKFLSHFDSLDSPNAMPDGDLAYQTEYSFLLSESMRPGNHTNMPRPIPDGAAMFTTYHPLLVESHFSVLICQLMLADFATILPTFTRTASLIDGLEGYPIFLPPRSMAQAEFIEVLERLAGGWRNGIKPHSLSAQRGKSKLAIEGPSLVCLLSPAVERDEAEDDDLCARSSSSSTRKDSASNGECSLNPALIQPMNSTLNGHLPKEDPNSRRLDAVEALDSARILLAPVAKRQRERAEKSAADKASGGKRKPVPINIPLHGPRVEVILAWLGAVHLPELDVDGM